MGGTSASRRAARESAAARKAARARSRELAGELTRLGIPAQGAPGGDRAGVWLDGGDAELAAKVLQWAGSRGLVITRETFGLPPAAPVPAEYAPGPEYQPAVVSEQMLDAAVTAYSAPKPAWSRRDERTHMIAALTAAGLWDDVAEQFLMEAALDAYCAVPVGSYRPRDQMRAALTAVLARIPPPAGSADDSLTAPVTGGPDAHDQRLGAETGFGDWDLDRLIAQRDHLQSVLLVSAGQRDRPQIREEHDAMCAEIARRTQEGGPL
jgi:hypothetical protein